MNFTPENRFQIGVQIRFEEREFEDKYSTGLQAKKASNPQNVKLVGRPWRRRQSQTP